MRYLLDTNVLIFLISGNSDNLSSEVSDVLSDYSNQLFISSLTLVEIIYLLNNQKIKNKFKNSDELFRVIAEDLYIQTLHTKDEHLKVYSKLQIAKDHKDQIDHFIISQAICEKIPLVSSDRKFREYQNQNLNFVYNKR
ncbi:type II toxin-antitoxin system VapC family toxin [Kaistella sp.]|uniref:type II toxin-antitoxin system VapC family toxin n=1 Tax=Kaistella sp. TaxID=2782235 RepID=UPI003C510329